MNIGLIGYGFVGQAMDSTFKKHTKVTIYDKYQNEHSDISGIIDSEICFVAVPTPSCNNGYDLSALNDVLTCLTQVSYTGIVVIKSTVLPGTTRKFIRDYPSLKIIHNPEFLTARTAAEDFAKQSHIIIGYENEEYGLTVKNFYQSIFPEARISSCNTLESESTKIFCNCYYAVKIQLFTEFKLLCDSNHSDFNKVRQMMLENSWINPMHTTIPGPDGQLSFGGLCFPKDLTALVKHMENNEQKSEVLSAALLERNQMRDN